MEVTMGRRRSRSREAALITAVASSQSVAGVLRALGLRVAGGNYQTVHRAIAELALDTSHWTGERHRKGSCVPVVPARPLAQILVRESYFRSSLLRERLIAEGVFEKRCSECRLSEWRGGPIPLELDHRDGDRRNNVLRNLRLLCPNCHALTPTYRGRNKRTKSRNIAAEPGWRKW